MWGGRYPGALPPAVFCIPCGDVMKKNRHRKRAGACSLEISATQRQTFDLSPPCAIPFQSPKGMHRIAGGNAPGENATQSVCDPEGVAPFQPQ